MYTRALRALLPVLLLACAAPVKGPAPRSHDVITAEQLKASRVNDLYQAIQQLRPYFLHERGFSSISGQGQVPMVYVDNVSVGDVEALKSINTVDVEEVRRLSAQEATTRFGTGHTGGAIEVITHAARAREK